MKRPLPPQGDQPVAKKPRLDGGGERKPYTDGAPAKTRMTAKVLPSQPPVRAAAASTKHAKPSYGGPQTSTNLQLVSTGAATHRRTIPEDHNSKPNKPSISQSFQKGPRLEPPRLDPPRLGPSPHEAHHKSAAPPSDDRLYSLPPQPRPFVYRPPGKTSNPTIRSKTISAPQASTSKYTAPVDADLNDHEHRKQAGPTATAGNRPDSRPKRPPATAKERVPLRGQADDPPGMFLSHLNAYSSLTSFTLLYLKPQKFVPTTDPTRSPSDALTCPRGAVLLATDRLSIQVRSCHMLVRTIAYHFHIAEPRAPKHHAHGRPDAIPKPASNVPRRQGAPRSQPEPPPGTFSWTGTCMANLPVFVVEPRVTKNRSGA